MSKINKVILVALAVIIVVIGISVTQEKKNESQTQTFGLISNLSGDYAVVGEAFAKGAKLAQDEWNIAHPNQQIEMIVEDDGFDTKKGLSAYKKLISIDHVDGLINSTTITIDAIYEDVTKSGLPVALGFEQGIDASNDNIVQLWPGTVPAEAELGKHIREKGFKNVVIFIDNTSIGYQRFAEGFKKGYGLPVQEIKLGTDGTDVKSSALKAKNLKPDAIVFITNPTSGALLVKELTSLSKDKYQFVFDAIVQTGFADYSKLLGDTNILNGSILYTVPSVYRDNFTSSYKKKYGTDATIGSETGYNAFKLLAESYNADKAKWVTNMQKASFIGADGKIIFDENGVRIPELKIGTVENGKLPN